MGVFLSKQDVLFIMRRLSIMDAKHPKVWAWPRIIPDKRENSIMKLVNSNELVRHMNLPHLIEMTS